MTMMPPPSPSNDPKSPATKATSSASSENSSGVMPSCGDGGMSWREWLTCGGNRAIYAPWKFEGGRTGADMKKRARRPALRSNMFSWRRGTANSANQSRDEHDDSDDDQNMN